MTSAFLNTEIHLKPLTTGINKMEGSREFVRSYVVLQKGSKGAN